VIVVTLVLSPAWVFIIKKLSKVKIEPPVASAEEVKDTAP